MNRRIQTILFVSRDAAFSEVCKKQLRDAGDEVRAEMAASLEEANAFAQRNPPDVILLDETALVPTGGDPAGGTQELERAATRLAGLAPVVVVAAAERQSEMAGLLAAGAADFVARAGHFPPVAIGLLERRLRNTVPESSEAERPSGAGSMTLLEMEEDFGEILRHEINNPLTGILGNAELLLAEVRRRNDGRLPLGAQRRLETIADLAVRLRETVRRLSQSWEARHDHVRSA
jgi:signal transduction histidine kinase